MTFGLLPGGLSPETIREGRAFLAQWTAELALRDVVEAFEHLVTQPFHAAIALIGQKRSHHGTQGQEDLPWI
jgi:hypothetical protein